MTLPTFLVAGAQKAGTTWLYKALHAHPGVGMSSSKEPHFFDTPERWRRGLDWYRTLFPDQPPPLGEATPNTMWTAGIDGWRHGIPNRVHQALGDVRTVVVLRHPTNRAISAYHHHVGRRRFAPGTPLRDVAHRWGIVSMGFYAAHLSRWWEVFDRRDTLVVRFDDLFTQAAFDRICRHVGAPVSPVADGLLGREVHKGNRRGRVSPEDRVWLDSVYADDLDHLDSLIGRPLW